MSGKVITITADGSPTIYVPGLKEHYHSIHGAIQESAFVFITNALCRVKKQSVRLFETGFGTGLNACLSFLEAEEKKVNIFYHTIEKFPLDNEIWKKLAGFLQNERQSDVFKRIHECRWEEEVRIGRFFTLKKTEADFKSYNPQDSYDVIYFDAFSPDTQPELWTKEIFSKICSMMNHGAVLTTYSCKGSVRRTMESAGLIVKRIPGPPGKRHITTAFKQ